MSDYENIHWLERMLRAVPIKGGIEVLFQKNPFLRTGYKKAIRKIFANTTLPFSGINVMENEWDYLIVLDACRYDSFKRYNEYIDGRLHKKISLAVNTTRWIKKNFKEIYQNTVYVSANPHVSESMLKTLLGFNPFTSIEDVWDYGWDDTLDTVPPKEVRKATVKNAQRYPDKKIISHYIQPHIPFLLGPRTGKEWAGRDKAKGNEAKNVKRIWSLAESGKINRNKLWSGYVSNLKIVLNDVAKLVKELNGRIIITSDHGNCLGDFWLYGHPNDIYISPLFEIPWLEVEV